MEYRVDASSANASNGRVLSHFRHGTKNLPGWPPFITNDEYKGEQQQHGLRDNTPSFLEDLDIDLDFSKELVGYDTPGLANSSCICDTHLSHCYTLPQDASKPSMTSYHYNENNFDLTLSLDLDKPAIWGGTSATATPFETCSNLELISKRARAKFTQREDDTIINLRRNGKTWKEIAEELPGRSPGALQVRYSTKLRWKSVDWTAHLVSLFLLLLVSLSRKEKVIIN